VLYLHQDWPAATEITHYHHGQDAEAAFCPACAGSGLILQSAFATSGGAGIRPSINGVPPVYVLPQGQTLFESLIFSLVTPPYMPQAAEDEADHVWWRREPLVEAKAEVDRVGYLHSLTFPARQVRLHPSPSQGRRCSRCGGSAEWLIASMVFNMGESRPKEAPWWQDPFVAYRRRAKGEPTPLRPQEGRALWRDYGSLFLPSVFSDFGDSGALRPRLLEQIDTVAESMGWLADDRLHFRCVGLRTDGKAKIYEWVDQGLDVPLGLLHDEEAASAIQRGLGLVEGVASTLRYVWRQSFQGSRSSRHAALADRLLADYWQSLAIPFERLVLSLAAHTGGDAESQLDRSWASTVISIAQRLFERTSAQIGDDAASLRERVQGESHCRAALALRRKEYLNEP
jgi:CRISPR system Cascade subunit CasA